MTCAKQAARGGVWVRFGMSLCVLCFVSFCGVCSICVLVFLL